VAIFEGVGHYVVEPALWKNENAQNDENSELNRINMSGGCNK